MYSYLLNINSIVYINYKYLNVLGVTNFHRNSKLLEFTNVVFFATKYK